MIAMQEHDVVFHNSLSQATTLISEKYSQRIDIGLRMFFRVPKIHFILYKKSKIFGIKSGKKETSLKY